jgi:hypothetical protein
MVIRLVERAGFAYQRFCEFNVDHVLNIQYIDYRLSFRDYTKLKY